MYRRIASDNSNVDTHWIGDCLKPSGNPYAMEKRKDSVHVGSEASFVSFPVTCPNYYTE